MYRKTWKPSRAAAREFAQTMNEISDFCAAHGITQSRRGDSYYFVLGGKAYRVSNHTVEASDAAAYDEFGNQIREKYHNGRDAGTVYITAGKTRIREIYNDIAAGYELDKRGYRI